MLEVWGRKTSSNVQALMWCIGELELPYQRYDVGHKYGGTDTEDFYLLNPNRTIPVIRDDLGPPFWETGAILRYLACRYGHETFWPKDLLERTNVDRWTEWAKISVAMNFNEPIFWRVVRTPAHLRDPSAIKKAVESFEKRLMIAETQLSRYQYLAGNDFTLADIQFGHVLFRYFDIDICRAELPQLRKYYEGLRQRLPYREHVMISYEELRV
ncbi:TPA: glutathione S-transferase family protein [Klebsiella pneumoniae]|uniref:glutathione S-transferase family protein n=1 Tax=Klebsiella variicola TaxID=244366 RepID=UPI000671E59E|nr:glutathione S-transferase family protein [Klebsiella variicola]HBY7807603.1 glutathione S-transferase family protein [Klebsiella pneumoniae]MCQ3871893.1 glutathione S-transferase family protein [Klebsiella variicola]CTQ24162.1 Glutathione S-transferase domain protein [Klebsiella variicola]SXE22178.1 glutathione S-transferase family protein [Klebsiella variicola]VEC94920.1 Glutathione S-transferase [Klebsiella variicola]